MSLRRIATKVSTLAALAVVALMPLSAAAQERQPSKLDLYVGYSWLDANGRVGGTPVETMNKGFNTRTTYFFDRHWGVTLDSAAHFADTARVSTIMVGPTVRFPMDRVTPFAHFLVGMHRLAPGAFQPDTGIGLTAGGGFDLDVHPVVSVRLLDASLQYAHHNFQPLGGRTNHTGARLGAGLVFKFGTIGPPPPPPSAACAATPVEVYEGEPVAVTATPSNFNPKRSLTYSWTNNGNKVEGTAATVNIDTKGMQPGTYTVRSSVSDGKKGMADCSATFTVKQPRGPVISCSANPATVQAGQTSMINCTGSSPDGRSLTYAHNANGGNLTAEGANARLATDGAQPGPITVSSTVTDDRNMSASTNTTVTVENPPPAAPAAPEASKINEIFFAKNSARVDNAAKAVLDEVALRLQRDADAKVVIIGGSDTGERNGKRLSGQRAINAKAYLVKEKGIDASRVEVRSGGTGMNAVFWIVPAGAEAPGEGEAVAEPRR